MLVEVVATDAEDAGGFVGAEGEPWAKFVGGWNGADVAARGV